MSSTYVFGAGASYSYADSSTSVHPPMAAGFFSAYCELDISDDIEVRIGDIVAYVREVYGIPDTDFCTLEEDAESFMTQLDKYVDRQVQIIKGSDPESEEFGILVNRVRSHDQMIFLFAHVLNEIQNGPISTEYSKFLSSVSPVDTIITFNWDTLLDRALEATNSWAPDYGYGLEFRQVFEAGWRDPFSMTPMDRPPYLKLHGSTNWLVNYMTWDLTTGQGCMVTPRGIEPGITPTAVDPQFLEGILSGEYDGPSFREVDWGFAPPPTADDPEGKPFLMVDPSVPYTAYKDRYRAGYQRYSYFFPPNVPNSEVPLMPLMVPPTKYKLFDEYAHILDALWNAAQSACSSSDVIYLIGYSLPPTDHRSHRLFKHVVEVGSPRWVVVNPNPNKIIERLVHDCGIHEEAIEVEAATFQEFIS